jgi:hypothetical protein
MGAVPAWVEQHRERVGFGLQAFPIDTLGDKAKKMLAAGRLAETLDADDAETIRLLAERVILRVVG